MDPLPFAGHSLQPSSFYGLGGTLEVPEERALCTLVPYNTTSVGPCHPDPEEDISGLQLCHRV
jgi:hypothetical protein